MPQQHLDRLTSTDASFLHQEGRSSHMHIGGVLVFEGPPPSFRDYLEHVRSRLHLVPRYRQKLAVPPLETGRPLWVDDASFNLEYHVRHSALPAPGGEAQLFRLAGRIASQPLDRSRPLWESWMIEGLDDDRFALIFKTHHALVDGISGVDLATVLFDIEAEPSHTPQASGDLEPWQPRPEPSPAELVVAGVAGAVRTTGSLLGRAIAAASRPATSLGLVREAAEGVGEIVWAALNPAPETPLNVPIGPHRRFAVARQRLADYKEIKDALGGTVNDVVLTVVSGSLRRWLESRGVRTEGLEMRALVPVSVRTQEQRGTLGNQLAVMRGPLPVFIKDPVARLDYVRRAMDGLKESKQAVGAATLAQVTNLAPPTVLAQASRLNFSTRLFNLLVTNVPGPQIPIYVLGRQLEDLYPLAFLPENHALAIAIMSYNGALDYGLLGDYDAMADIDAIADGLAEERDELLAAARARTGRRATGRARGGTRARGETRAPGGTRAPRETRAPGETRPRGGREQISALAAETPKEGDAGEVAPLIPGATPRAKRGPAADMRRRHTEGSNGSRENGSNGNGSAGEDSGDL